MKRGRLHITIAMAAMLVMALAGCGGGGEGASKSTPPPGGPSSPALAWDPPTTYSDNTVMDPYRDLDYYEIYLRGDANFTDNEAPIAQVAAITNVLSADGKSYHLELTSNFALNNLLPFTQPGTIYYLSVKSVGVDGLKSNFSAPVIWHLT
jgi:hypothetical protein